MNILLNITDCELTKFSGDLSFYRHLLDLKVEGLKFHTLNGRGRILREVRKVFERVNRRCWPEGIRQALFRASRWSYLHPSNLKGMDLVVSHILFPYMAVERTPIIWSSQGISPSFYYDATGPFTQEDVVHLYNTFGSKASLLMIWTRSGCRNVQNLCSLRTPIKVLPPITNFQSVDENSRKLQPKQAACQILFVGRDPSRKGLFDVLEAYRRLLAKGIDLAFDAVSRLTPAQERELGSIRGVTLYMGITDALVAELMERADVLVLPTYAETYGFVLLEAMARGCALITSDYEPLNELVVEGENGFVVKPGDVERMAERLEELVLHPHLINRFKENSLRKYRDEFSSERLIPQYVNMFSEVVEQRLPRISRKERE